MKGFFLLFSISISISFSIISKTLVLTLIDAALVASCCCWLDYDTYSAHKTIVIRKTIAVAVLGLELPGQISKITRAIATFDPPMIICACSVQNAPGGSEMPQGDFCISYKLKVRTRARFGGLWLCGVRI
jgi:hypothetical protein